MLSGGCAGWETGLFLQFPSDTAVCTPPCEVCLLLSHLFFLKYKVFELVHWTANLSVSREAWSRSPAFVILILSFRVFGTLSADLVSEIYIQSTNTSENIKPGQRQTLWVCTCSHFPVRSWIRWFVKYNFPFTSFPALLLLYTEQVWCNVFLKKHRE